MSSDTIVTQDDFIDDPTEKTLDVYSAFTFKFTDSMSTYFNTVDTIDILSGTYKPCGEVYVDDVSFSTSVSADTGFHDHFKTFKVVPADLPGVAGTTITLTVEYNLSF